MTKLLAKDPFLRARNFLGVANGSFDSDHHSVVCVSYPAYESVQNLFYLDSEGHLYDHHPASF